MTSKFLDEPFEGVIRQGADTFLIHPASGSSLSFDEAYSSADTISESFPEGVLLLAAKDRLVFALTYLAALRSNTPVLVVDHEAPIESLQSLAKVFNVSSAVIDGHEGFYSWARTSLENNVSLFVNPEVSTTLINKDLAALMPTSGSTGSPKCVRVSYNNIRASALAIGQYLKISTGRVLIASLPLHYTYGLSLLHVAMGHRVPLVLSEHSTFTSDFWSDFLKHKATDFSGVPFQYEMILRSGTPTGVFDQMKCMTQAGGRLDPDKTSRFLELAETFGFLYFTMYGQTEATPRISYVPPDFAASKVGSVGIPIPGGSLSIERNQDTEESGEVVYSGPNVCLGYASSASDLGLPDEFRGVLKTGDLGYLDEDGYLFITGRANRDIKVSGKRVSLDALEQSLTRLGGEHAVLGVDESILVVSVGVEVGDVRKTLQAVGSIHPSKISIVILPSLPRLSSGKVDYQSLKKEFLHT